MYLPSEAVFGFDRTHIRRISPQEYREEDDSPIAPPRTRCLTGSSRICNLLRSRDPNVEFCSKFPIRDSLGCEISVTYQIICMEVRTELQRVTQGGALTRRSGVLPSTGMGLLDEGDRCRRSSVPEQEEVDRIHRNGLEVKARPVTHVHVPSLLNGDGVSSARLPAKGTCITTALSQQDTSNISGHGRISSFSIYCDSGCNPCGVAQLRETVVDQQQQPSQQLPEPQSVVVSDGRQSLFASGLVCLPDNKLERVLNAEDIQDYLQASQATCLAPPQRSSTASPAQIVGKRRKKEREVDDGWDNVQNNRVSVCEAAIAEPILLGTTGSPEPRATKRLFTINHVSNFRRTAHHAELIPSQAYGVHSKTIPAALVDPLINKCLEKLYSGREFLAVNASAPQLQPGLIVPMGDYSYHIVRYHASSDVFEAREVQSKGANRTQILENDIASSLDSPLPQVLIYRWSVRAFQQGINETHRAALGLSHIVPSTAMSVGVSGYLYTDAGLTVITVPNPYYAVPLSLVPLSARSFPTCIKLLLKMLSDLVVRRTVHGNLRGLNHVFLAMPRGIEGTRILPSILIPVHWERLVDFSMFVDRNAGRTIPLSGSCGSDEDEHIYHGHDVTSVTGLVLESEHAAQLQQQQLAEMHNLVTLSVKKAQVASYLVQLKDAMSVLPSDMEALREEYETVLKGSH